MKPALNISERIPFAPAAILAAKVASGALRRGLRRQPGEDALREWMSAVRRDGVHAVEEFLTSDQCNDLREAIDGLFGIYPEAVQRDAIGADQRIFLGVAPPGGIGQFFDHAQLLKGARAILGKSAVNLATLANRIRDIPGNPGSGGGWHRDSFANQFKAILYLNDVDEQGGPFQYIRGSHHMKNMIRDRKSAGLGVSQTRIRDEQIERLISKEPDRLMTLPGRAGTLILADTTGLHRGAPVLKGTRYALTNYFYPPHAITGGLKDKFKPILGVHMPYARTASTSMESI